MDNGSLALRKISCIFMRDVRLALAYPASAWTTLPELLALVVSLYFISKLVGPSTLFGANGHAVPYFNYVAINVAFLRFQGVAISSFQRAVRGDQLMGTVEAVLLTPTQLPLLILSSSLYAFAVTALQIALFIGVALLLGLDLSHVNVQTTLAFLSLTILAMSPLGVLSAASIMYFKQAPPTGLLVGGVSSLLGGVLFPTSKLPELLQHVSWLLPITHALNGMRGAVGGQTVWQLRGDVLWLAVMSIVVLPIALDVFARAVRRAKVDGTLGDY